MTSDPSPRILSRVKRHWPHDWESKTAPEGWKLVEKRQRRRAKKRMQPEPLFPGGFPPPAEFDDGFAFGGYGSILGAGINGYSSFIHLN